MTLPIYHLAQLNIARLRAPLDSPELKEFVDFLDPLNRFAEESPGFIWRLAGEDGQASSLLPPEFDDPMIIVNLTIWKDIAALRSFAYGTVHRYFLQNRRTWFEPLPAPYMVLWWAPAGEIPTLKDAKAKLRLLEERGPTPDAFSMQAAFDANGQSVLRESRATASAQEGLLPKLPD